MPISILKAIEKGFLSHYQLLNNNGKESFGKKVGRAFPHFLHIAKKTRGSSRVRDMKKPVRKAIFKTN